MRPTNRNKPVAKSTSQKSDKPKNQNSKTSKKPHLRTAIQIPSVADLQRSKLGKNPATNDRRKGTSVPTKGRSPASGIVAKAESVVAALDRLKMTAIEDKTGYRNKLYGIIVKTIVQGRNLLTNDQSWNAFIAQKGWGGKRSKKRGSSVRYALQHVFGDSKGSFYWKRVATMVENGLSETRILSWLKSNKLRPTTKKSGQPPADTIFEADDVQKPGKPKAKPSDAPFDGGVVKGKRGGFIVPFFFPDDDAHKEFRYDDGARIQVVGTLNQCTREVIVEHWQRL